MLLPSSSVFVSAFPWTIFCVRLLPRPGSTVQYSLLMIPNVLGAFANRSSKCSVVNNKARINYRRTRKNNKARTHCRRMRKNSWRKSVRSYIFGSNPLDLSSSHILALVASVDPVLDASWVMSFFISYLAPPSCNACSLVRL
jgi:hypothetical protein